MSKTDEKVIAILCADIHLSIKVPVWRSAEPDWFAAMQRPLDELTVLQLKYDCPILCAGDIFNKWNSSPELINWALKYLPGNMYCIPGQHDLPDHNYDEIHRSAYWTLVKAGKIQNISYGAPAIFEEKIIYGFPYGESRIGQHIPKDRTIKIALCHEYIWVPGRSYPDAPSNQKITGSLSVLGYGVMVFGDNHNGFTTSSSRDKNKTLVFNCGCLMKRKSDEINYKPQVGLLLASGEVKPYFLNISKDKHLDIIDDATAVEELDIEEFLEELKKLGDTSLEFTTAVERFFKKHKTHPSVQKILRKAGEE